MLMHFWRQLLKESSYSSFMADKDILEWTRESDGTVTLCGLTFLWLVLECIEPKSVIDTKEFEKLIRDTKLNPDCDDDVRVYCNTVVEAWDKLKLKHGDNAMSANTFTEHLFAGLMTAKNELFLDFIKRQKIEWMTAPDQFKSKDLTTSSINLYNSLVLQETWKEEPKEDPNVIALTTQNRQLQAENRKLKKTSKQNDSQGGGGDANKNGPWFTNGVEMAGPPGKKGGSIPKWRTIKKGEYMKSPQSGDNHQWCPHHFGDKGLYMLCNSADGKSHDHAKWKEMDDERRAKWEKKGKSKDKSGSKRGRTPSLKVKRKEEANKRVQVMVTEKGLDHPTALQIEALYTGTFEEGDSSDEESKE
mmetsp:Transcript_15233/g.22962  ORF Transcript_15233/g.22962 Transcript_15233/m.22962 type:complete len:360 (+) Transcript_15233:4158-5237(+)